MFSAIVTTVIGALLIAAILSAIKSHWLYVIAPKLYLNTPISGDGQIISINIYNAGLTTEEDVALTFRQACKFELIGTSKSTLAVVGQTISVSKVSRLESITIVLLIEGRAFDPIDIESIESKATKGKIVESKERATALWQNFVVFPLLITVLIIPFILGTYVGAELKVSAIEYIDSKLELFGDRKQLAGYKVSYRTLTNDEVFKKTLEKKKILIEVTEVLRRKDILTITTRFTNKMSEPLLFEGRLTSSAGGRGSLGFDDDQFDSFAIGPDESRVVVQRAYLPEDLQTKFVDNKITVNSLNGDYLSVSQLMQF